MKRPEHWTIIVFAALLLSVLGGCSDDDPGGGSDGAVGSAFTPPESTPGVGGAARYTNAQTYSSDNVADLWPGGTSAEAAVVHFYASLIRGDERYKEVLPETWDDSLSRKMEKILAWTYTQFRLVSRAPVSGEPNRLYIKVWLELNGDSGEDEVEVEDANGTWRVVVPPT